MNSVFENIIEKLEEMIHTKQLYFCKYARGGCKHLDNDDKDCMECVVENAIEIVKQEAEQHNNGWIPCSSGRLPEENTDVEVTIEEIANDVGGKRYYNVRSWLQDGQWVVKKNPYNPTVIAWKYPTEPYQPKGE